MKNLKKIIGVFILVSMFMSAAMAENPEKNDPESPYRQMFLNEVRDLVVYPDFAIQLGIEGFVLVSFNYDENGNIKILESNSNSEMLKYYVANTLKNLDMCGHAKAVGKLYNLRFDFKLI